MMNNTVNTFQFFYYFCFFRKPDIASIRVYLAEVLYCL